MTETTMTSRDELTLTLTTTEPGETISQTLKNPNFDSAATVSTINRINASLAGGLSGMWFSDREFHHEITSISKVVHLEQTTRKTPIYTGE